MEQKDLITIWGLKNEKYSCNYFVPFSTMRANPKEIPGQKPCGIPNSRGMRHLAERKTKQDGNEKSLDLPLANQFKCGISTSKDETSEHKEHNVDVYSVWIGEFGS